MALNSNTLHVCPFMSGCSSSGREGETLTQYIKLVWPEQLVHTRHWWEPTSLKELSTASLACSGPPDLIMYVHTLHTLYVHVHVYSVKISHLVKTKFALKPMRSSGCKSGHSPCTFTHTCIGDFKIYIRTWTKISAELRRAYWTLGSKYPTYSVACQTSLRTAATHLFCLCSSLGKLWKL